ncbi:hypothetical protein ACFXKX_35670 [Streptomyces scopuliridis]|uniref:hypothetical protein n=1 Tax=Streptomyces scopuliridis TaxID=452529 RepID=UPI00367B98E7
MIHCRVLVYTADRTVSYELDSYGAISPRLAVRWLQWRGSVLADELDPDPPWPEYPSPRVRRADAGTAGVAGFLRTWCADPDAHAAAMDQLRDGRILEVTARGSDRLYVLTAVSTLALFSSRRR